MLAEMVMTSFYVFSFRERTVRRFPKVVTCGTSDALHRKIRQMGTLVAASHLSRVHLCALPAPRYEKKHKKTRRPSSALKQSARVRCADGRHRRRG